MVRAMRAASATVALAMLLAACTSSTAGEAPSTSLSETDEVVASPAPTPAPSSTPAGAEPAADRARTRFAGRISQIPPALEHEMTGTTWHEGCPVAIADLRLLRFNYRGFDGQIKRGPMVVNASVASDVLWVFGQLFDAGFPMKRVGLSRAFHERRWEDDPDTRRSVTASFNCRVVVTPDGPGDEFSQHAYGLAVDVNPLQNPFVRSDGWVHNRFAEPYVDRSQDLLGMVHDGDVLVDAFAAIGWAWGGHWSGDKDYMHFSQSGT